MEWWGEGCAIINHTIPTPEHCLRSQVNLALRGLPRFKCLPDEIGQHRTTTHILPPGDSVLQDTQRAFEEAQAGKLPAFPTIEMYFHTTVDPSIAADSGLHSAALFVQWVPHTLAESSWEDQEAAYVDHLIGLVERFAPGTGRETGPERGTVMRKFRI